MDKASNKGVMQQLFEKDQLQSIPRKTRTKKPTYVERKIDRVVGGVRETSLLMTAPMGKLRLEALTDRDWKKQLSDILHTYGRIRSNDFAKRTSEETLRNRMDILFSTITPIMKERKLQSLSQVKPRLLPRMFEIWNEAGVGKRAQINYFNVMRWYWRVFGIEIEPIAAYAKEPGEFTINRNADRDKSWTGNGVNFEEKYEEMKALDPVAARLMVAMKTYGLRLKESLCLQPHEADGQKRLLLTKGTKTGRARQLEFEVFDEGNFRVVLDQLKDEVPPECHLAWQNRSLKQAKRHLFHLAEKIGLTKKASGVTFHGLRTEFAIDCLEKLTGTVAPVRGGLALNYKKLAEARRLITRAMGHSRPAVTGAYYGSFASMESEQLREFTRSWEKLEKVMEKVAVLMYDSGVENLYLIGQRALGAPGNHKPFEFVFPVGTDDEMALHLAPQIADLVLGATGIDSMVHNWKSLPRAKQILWETEAVPIFAAVGPLEYMKARLQEQKAARLGWA